MAACEHTSPESCPSSDVVEAHRLVDSGEAGGKVVLTP